MMIMTMNINLIIESIDIHGQKNTEKVQGLKKVENDKIYYSYQSDMGKCELIVSQDYLKMKRLGEANIELEMNSSGNGEMIYSTMGFEKEFSIKNATIDLSTGNIAFSYDIMEGDEKINTLTIRVWEA